MPDATRPVLVVSDGRPRDAEMLELAAREAVAQGVPLAVAAVSAPVTDPRFSLTAMLAEERRDADLLDSRLRQAVATLSERYPSLVVTSYRLHDQTLGWPDEATGDLADASLLVVPDRGQYSQPVFTEGSTSRYLLKSTSCPVLVVPQDLPVARTGPTSDPDADTDAGPVVVAVGEDQLAARVLAVARQEAADRRALLRVVHAFSRRPGESADEARERAGAFCADLLPQDADGAPGTEGAAVEVVLTDGDVADVLVEHGRTARLLVLGTRGPAALAGYSPASVCRAVLDRAPCPVLVVLPRRARPVRLPSAAAHQTA